MANSRNDHNLQQRLREGALVLPVIGFFLLTPPFINVFSIESTLFGIPAIVIYIFVVWSGLIIVSRVLANKLMSESSPEHRESEQEK